MSGSTLTCSTDECDIVCGLSLRSDVPAKERFWRHDFGDGATDIYIDETQDLLVRGNALGGTLNFLSIRTGKAHPSTQRKDACEPGVLKNMPFNEFHISGEWALFIHDPDSPAAYPDQNEHRVNAVSLYHWPSSTYVKVRHSISCQ